jgi:flagellar basal-body rod protein FlgB
MLGRIETNFRFNETVLRLRAARQEVLASNIANADTPNYKARDFDFGRTLQAALTSSEPPALPLAKTNPNHLDVTGGTSWLEGQLQYRHDIQPSIDGNTVDVNTEMAHFTDNALRYQASLTFLQRRFEGLRNALQPQ